MVEADGFKDLELQGEPFQWFTGDREVGELQELTALGECAPGEGKTLPAGQNEGKDKNQKTSGSALKGGDVNASPG